jgi:HTH-type transcriptional regulator/antitoxin HipB
MCSIGDNRESKDSAVFRELRTTLEVGILIRRTRLARGLSQAQLAEKVGASRKWIVEIEAGKPTSEFGRVLQVLNELGIQIGFDDGTGASPQQKAASDFAQEILSHRSQFSRQGLPKLRIQEPPNKAKDK